MELPKPVKLSNIKGCWFIGSLVVALVAFGLIWAYQTRYIPGKITFRTYSPSYLPDGLAVQVKVIEDVYTPSNKPQRITSLKLTFSAHSFAYERKNVHHFAYGCRGYENESCVTGTTPRGQPYVLTTTQISGQPADQSVEWLEGNTYILVAFFGERSQPYPPEVVERIIDSFQPTGHQNLPVTHIEHSQI